MRFDIGYFILISIAGKIIMEEVSEIKNKSFYNWLPLNPHAN